MSIVKLFMHTEIFQYFLLDCIFFWHQKEDKQQIHVSLMFHESEFIMKKKKKKKNKKNYQKVFPYPL